MRHVEGLVRLGEAVARLYFSCVVIPEQLRVALRLIFLSQAPSCPGLRVDVDGRLEASFLTDTVTFLNESNCSLQNKRCIYVRQRRISREKFQSTSRKFTSRLLTLDFFIGLYPELVRLSIYFIITLTGLCLVALLDDVIFCNLAFSLAVSAI